MLCHEDIFPNGHYKYCLTVIIAEVCHNLQCRWVCDPGSKMPLGDVMVAHLRNIDVSTEVMVDRSKRTVHKAILLAYYENSKKL